LFWEHWLDPNLTDKGDVQAMINSVPEPHLEPYEIGVAVNASWNHDPRVLEPSQALTSWATALGEWSGFPQRHPGEHLLHLRPPESEVRSIHLDPCVPLRSEGIEHDPSSRSEYLALDGDNGVGILNPAPRRRESVRRVPTGSRHEGPYTQDLQLGGAFDRRSAGCRGRRAGTNLDTPLKRTYIHQQ